MIPHPLYSDFIEGDSAWGISGVARYLKSRKINEKINPILVNARDKGPRMAMANASMLCIPRQDQESRGEISKKEFSRWIGIIGENLAQYHFKRPLSPRAFGDANGQDHGFDAVINGKNYNIKTMHRTIPPEMIRGTYVLNISTYDAFRNDQAADGMHYMVVIAHVEKGTDKNAEKKIAEARGIFYNKYKELENNTKESIGVLKKIIFPTNQKQGKDTYDNSDEAKNIRKCLKELAMCISSFSIIGGISRSDVKNGLAGIFVPAGVKRENDASVCNGDIIEIPLAQLSPI